MWDLVVSGLYLAALLVPLVSVAVLAVKRCGILHWVAAVALASVASYLCMLGGYEVSDIHDELRMRAFDLDGNGLFTTEEQTPECLAVMAEVCADTGKNIGRLIYPWLAAMLSLFWHAVGGVFYLLARWGSRLRAPTC